MKRWQIVFIATAGVLVVGVVLFFALGGQVWIGRTLTPELLGDANAVFVKMGSRLIGVTWSNYAGFWVYGNGSEDLIQCRLVHALGGAIVDVNGPIPCLMQWNQTGRFQGWIDFRGHPRAFCGVSSAETFPANCRLRLANE